MAALSYGDAVSNDALAIQGHLRGAGFDSDIFAEHAHPRMAHRCRRLWEYGAVSSAETVCVFHFAIGSGAGRFIFQAPDRLVTRYHNITPPELLAAFLPHLARQCHQGRLVILAPHGGSIEPGTDQQAERVLAALGNDIAGAWRCKGFATEGAFRRFHITSSDLHESSFPLLATIASRNFLHAVAFHGFTAQGILIGGGAPPFIKEKLAQALEGVLAGEIPVRIANDSDDFDGDNPRNIVNRLTAGGKGGVQIEQSRLARDKYWKEIADAVAGVYHRIC